MLKAKKRFSLNTQKGEMNVICCTHVTKTRTCCGPEGFTCEEEISERHLAQVARHEGPTAGTEAAPP